MLDPESHCGDSVQHLVPTNPRTVKLAGLPTADSRVKKPDKVGSREWLAMNFGIVDLLLPSLLTAHLFTDPLVSL